MWKEKRINPNSLEVEAESSQFISNYPYLQCFHYCLAAKCVNTRTQAKCCAKSPYVLYIHLFRVQTIITGKNVRNEHELTKR